MVEFKTPLLMKIASVMVCIALLIPFVSRGAHAYVVWAYSPCAGMKVPLYSTYLQISLNISALLIVIYYAGWYLFKGRQGA